jgi:hypothetical protein
MADGTGAAAAVSTHFSTKWTAPGKVVDKCRAEGTATPATVQNCRVTGWASRAR